MPDRQESLLECGDRVDFKELQDICNMARNQIEIRSGGLLQIRRLEGAKGISPHNPNDLVMQEVAFIHRTAHDFFTKTDAGRSILRADSVTRLEVATCAARGLLCLHRIMAHQHDVIAEMLCVLDQIGRLSEENDATAVAKVIDMLPVLQSFFAENIISGSGTWQPKCHFLTYLVPYISFHEFILSEIEKASPEKLATQVLQELCCEMGIPCYSKRLVPLGLIGPLILMGADAHACIGGQELGQNREKHQELLIARGTSFANFLRLSITASFFDGYKDGDLGILVSEVVTTMATTCPDLNDATLIVFRTWNTGRIMLEKDSNRVHNEKKYASIVVEAKLSFLVAYLFSQLKPFIEESAVFNHLSGRLDPPRPDIQFVFTLDDRAENWICSCISSPKSCEKLIDFLSPREGRPPQTNERIGKHSFETRKRFDHIVALLRHVDLFPCDFKSEMLSMAAEKLGGCNLPEAEEVQEARGHFDLNIIDELVALATCKNGW